MSFWQKRLTLCLTMRQRRPKSKWRWQTLVFLAPRVETKRRDTTVGVWSTWRLRYWREGMNLTQKLTCGVWASCSTAWSWETIPSTTMTKICSESKSWNARSSLTTQDLVKARRKWRVRDAYPFLKRFKLNHQKIRKWEHPKRWFKESNHTREERLQLEVKPQLNFLSRRSNRLREFPMSVCRQ